MRVLAASLRDRLAVSLVASAGTGAEPSPRRSTHDAGNASSSVMPIVRSFLSDPSLPNAGAVCDSIAHPITGGPA
jgi:hypothetical protein